MYADNNPHPHTVVCRWIINNCMGSMAGCNRKYLYIIMRESNRNLDIPPPGIPGEFACLVFEEGGNLNFFLVEGGEFA